MWEENIKKRAVCIQFDFTVSDMPINRREKEKKNHQSMTFSLTFFFISLLSIVYFNWLSVWMCFMNALCYDELLKRGLKMACGPFCKCIMNSFLSMITYFILNLCGSLCVFEKKKKIQREKSTHNRKWVESDQHRYTFIRVTFQFHLLPHYDILLHLYLCVTH